jgi:hypothetical protein
MMTSAKRRPHKRKEVTDYLTSSEMAQLKRYGVTMSKTSLAFSKDLAESDLRRMWHLVSAIVRRRPKSEDWVNWLIGDWANKVSDQLGEKIPHMIIKEEEEAYKFTQHILGAAGATLLSLQMAEYAVAICCRLLDPSTGTRMSVEVFSPENVSRRRTLGQLNKQINDRKIFLQDFEQRMDAFVKRRNKFAHHLMVEHVHLVHLGHVARMKGLKSLESFLLALLVEANKIASIFFGLITAIGATIAERENVKNLEAFLDDQGADDWRDHLRQFSEVQRKA